MIYRLWMVVCTLVFVAQCALGANKPPQCHRPPQAPVVAAQPAGEKVIKTTARDSGTMGAQKTCPCSDACSCGCQEGEVCRCASTSNLPRVITYATTPAPSYSMMTQPVYQYIPPQPSGPVFYGNSYGGRFGGTFGYGGGFRGSRGGSCGGGG